MLAAALTRAACRGRRGGRRRGDARQLRPTRPPRSSRRPRPPGRRGRPSRTQPVADGAGDCDTRVESGARETAAKHLHPRSGSRSGGRRDRAVQSARDSVGDARAVAAPTPESLLLPDVLPPPFATATPTPARPAAADGPAAADAHAAADGHADRVRRSRADASGRNRAPPEPLPPLIAERCRSSRRLHRRRRRRRTASTTASTAAGGISATGTRVSASPTPTSIARISCAHEPRRQHVEGEKKLADRVAGGGRLKARRAPARQEASASGQGESDITPSPPSGFGPPMAIRSSPSDPDSKARTTAGAIRTTSH